MANAPHIPPVTSNATASSQTNAPVVGYDDVPETGVRKVLDALEEREVQRVRWGAVIAGLFIALGVQVLLGMLGAAIGLTVGGATGLTQAIGIGAAVWMAVTALIALFIGGYAASKLAGTIRRRDGVLTGILVWATSMVISLWLAGATAATAARALGDPSVSQGLRERTGQVMRPGGSGAAGAQRGTGDLGAAGQRVAEMGSGPAWATFAAGCLALLAALGGGALGAVGSRERRDFGGVSGRGLGGRGYESHGFQDRGFQDRSGQRERNYAASGFQESGLHDRALQERGIQDRGIQDRGIQDRGLEDRGLQERAYDDRGLREQERGQVVREGQRDPRITRR